MGVSSICGGFVRRQRLSHSGLRGITRTQVAFPCVLLLLAGAAASQPAREPSAETPPEQAAVQRAEESTADAAEPAGPGAANTYRTEAAHIHELIEGTLPVTIDAAQLFDLQLEDADAVALEAARLRALLGEPHAGELAADERASSTRESKPPQPPSPPENLDPDVWAARLDLDRARLKFYSLPASERSAHLTRHAQRQAADAESHARRESDAATRRAQEAAAERDRMLAAAEAARSEAERLVAEEHARLLGVAAQLAERQAELARAGRALAARAERTLALHRRVRQVTSPADREGDADALYQELRDWLRASRDELAKALATSPQGPMLLQAQPENDPLANLATPVDRRKVDALLQEIRATQAALMLQSQEFQDKHRRQLHEEVQSLNDDRLTLLPHLSAPRRAAITGFRAAGLDQALAELRQLSLVLRFHAHTVTTLLRGGSQRKLLGESAGTATSVLLQALLAIGLFYYGRRIAIRMLNDARTRLREAARSRRALDAGRTEGAIDLMERVLYPLSWMLLVLALAWILPPATAQLMEVQLLFTVLRWTIGGWLVVVTLDALAIRHARRLRRYGRAGVDALRLRSLRLIGISAVTAGLLLSMSRTIVGRGTVYSWLVTACLWAAVPIALVIVHWWRATIFQRMERVRRQSALRSWVLANQSGWRGLFAAALGGASLFAKGLAGTLRTWLGSFTVTRRFLAFVFRQQLDRLAERNEAAALAPLPPGIFDKLAADAASVAALERRDVPEAAEIINHIDKAGGGVFAVVGERGSGRSTVLRCVCTARPRVGLIDCPFDGIDTLTAVLAQSLGMPANQDLDTMAAQLDASGHDAAIIIDNAHRLIRPVMGGLAAFDRLIACARRHSTHCAWVLSVDSILWRFYGRARLAEQLFDEVVKLEGWSEEDIASLLQDRSREAGLQPRFDRLLTDEGASAAEDDLDELRTAAAGNYYRLIWDYAAGNPAVALHTWRTSLGVDRDGSVHVTPFRAPDQATFDKLPDSAVFVLRAVLQLERARAVDVAQATMVPIAEVESSLRYGLHSGYLQRVADRYAVAWHWYRPATRFLQRRHLLAGET